MDPLKETVIWPHEYNEVYELYDRIFNCKGHGWSNLQSTHINLPFSNDLEFEKLHAAVRLLLPIIPALSASTPIMDSSFQGFKDHRLEYYRKNQSIMPSIAGKVIPERAFSKKDYERLIFEPIRKEITPHDKEGILDKHFLNSRGAIARFDRMAVEIRIIDIQESPRMDIAILQLIDAAIKFLLSKQENHLEEQKSWDENILFEIFKENITSAENTLINNEDYIKLFGLQQKSITANELWKHIAKETKMNKAEINFILDRGSLSTRILEALDDNYSKAQILLVYKKLAKCLEDNVAFDPLFI
jgi:carboxylate-amine ligase